MFILAPISKNVLILFENLFKPRQLYLQPQSSALNSLRLAF
ncbi:DNA alkylation repair protein [Streptococcus pneumoniae]|nr:DNA alkylation repair protein [Streptococcus pneumoniae]PDQ24780.1 DNA alkylation repair protein [Streptococcus pneumoniae]PDQ26356.1 DNA alkylation repair protein [Streptococcus pneumoniae]PHP26056.1 DNA alkylation repair protein [Streptococcus pneumoniae]UKP33166.1 DNA alkylation repair protein [Streptococcus pneumoniae]